MRAILIETQVNKNQRFLADSLFSYRTQQTYMLKQVLVNMNVFYLTRSFYTDSNQLIMLIYLIYQKLQNFISKFQTQTLSNNPSAQAIQISNPINQIHIQILKNLHQLFHHQQMSLQPTASITLFKFPGFTQLSRMHKSIFGYDQFQQLFLQVDTKHSIVWNYPINTRSTNVLADCKYFTNFTLGDGLRQGYVCCFDKKIQKYSFNDKISNQKRKSTLLTSNSLATFTGTFDAYHNTLVCMKMHQNHGVFSINWLQGQKQKKIVKLTEFDPKSLHINKSSPQIIYTDPQNQVRYFDLQKPQKQTILIKKSTVLFDNEYLYCTSANLVSKFNDVYEVQVIDLKTGKHAFGFKGNRLPKKIQAFGDYLFYLTERGFFIYERRKNELIGHLDLDSEKGIGKNQGQRLNDFLIDPNLGKIYLSLTNQLKIFEFKFF